MDYTTSTLLQPYKMGPFDFLHRVVMSALTRCRADQDTGVPNDLHVKYYTERAESAAFVLTECSPVAEIGNCFPGSCGIYSEEQVIGWKRVTDSVHNVNGKIFIQIWHSGRVLSRIGKSGVCPSALPIRLTRKDDPNTIIEQETPKELSEEEIAEIVEQFRKGAQNALAAGFDGVELHGANGYLVDEFLRDAVNMRTDQYGGSIENRCRLALEIMDVLITVFGADRVGIKVSPLGRENDMFDSDPVKLYTYLLSELQKRNVCFVEIPRTPERSYFSNLYNIKGIEQISDLYQTFRPCFQGTLIANEDFTFEEGNEVVANGLADMVSFGNYFMPNPDLVNRFRNGWELAKHDRKKNYTTGAEGYIDYPKYTA